MIHHSILEYFNDKSWHLGPLKSVLISILLKIGMVKFLKNLRTDLIVTKQLFQLLISF